MIVSGFFLLIPCMFGILAILSTIFWIWMLVDCASKEPSQSNDKILWILVIVFTHFVGACIYYFVRRPERIRMLGF